jgi:hypothetical protein
MVNSIEIKVPDIVPYSTQEFPLEFFDSGKKPVADTEFRYAADNDKTLTGKTDANGVLNVRVRNYPPRNISLSLPA